MMRRDRGFTLPEVLIALVVIALAVSALALVQLNNLRSSVSARLSTETKAAANVVLEQLMAQVLFVDPSVPQESRTVEDFAFFHYYWSCPDAQTPPSGTPDPGSVTCSGQRTVDSVVVSYLIEGEGGILGEGVLTITVTGEHTQGAQRLTIGDRITCYDVYPSPSSTAPEPCPQPTSSGGGRT